MFGLTDGSFYRAPLWVDLKKPAGATSYDKTGYGSTSFWWVKYLTLEFFFLSPQIVWSLVTILVYILFPYDILAAREWSFGWIFNRALVNAGTYVLFTGYWHVTLYWLGWSKRKFSPEQVPTISRVIHNAYYGVLGTLMQTAWECMFLRLWATGRLDYIPDSEVFTSWSNALRVILGVIAVPAYRDFHFYFAHRFIHLRALYKYIHSLHHRNTAIEPFSGLCMHPVEHLYYVSCMGIHLFVLKSPLHLMANGMHLTLSPAASHSGWEDAWQSDQFHYLHHAKFECNYGTPAVPYDYWFGTYQDALPISEQDQKKKPKSYIPSGGDVSISAAVPTGQGTIYWCATIFVFLVGIVALKNDSFFYANPVAAKLVAGFIATGPMVFAMLLWRFSGDTLHFLWPFQKENPLVLFGHSLISFLCCVVPVYQLVLSCLSETSVPCTLLGYC